MTLPRVLASLSLAVATVLAVASTANAAAPQSVQIIKAGRLVDVTTGKVLNDQVIVIRGDQIREVGPSSSITIPADAKVIDLSTSTVLPGLIDTHTHLTSDPTEPPYHGYGISNPRSALKGAANARVTLLAGVT